MVAIVLFLSLSDRGHIELIRGIEHVARPYPLSVAIENGFIAGHDHPCLRPYLGVPIHCGTEGIELAALGVVHTISQGYECLFSYHQLFLELFAVLLEGRLQFSF
jgi:hypothetical protein